MHNRNRRNSPSRYASTPYTQIPDGFWLCPEFNALKDHSQRIFTIAIAKWNPLNPDEPFPMPYDEIQGITRYRRKKISEALKELQTAGFLEVPQRGAYPHNLSMYILEKKWIEQKYPKKPKPFSDYLLEFIRRRR